MADEATLAEGWWEHYRLGHGTRAERKALSLGEPAAVVEAWMQVDDVIRDGGPAAMALILEVVTRAQGEDELALAGAGPLETLIHQHGNELIDDLEHLARTSPVFQWAMSMVWLRRDHLDPPVERRIRPWVSEP